MTQRIEFQLYALGTGATVIGEIITAAGGVVYVAQAGDAQKRAITDKGGVALTNPRALTAGGVEFYVADSVVSADLYIMAPGGQFIVKKGIKPGSHDFAVDISQRHQVAEIPFAIADTAAATETDTGFNMPLHSAVLPNPMVRVLTVDATETIDVGLLSSETAGDANGFLALADVATAGLVKGTLISTGQTIGALLSADEGAGVLLPEAHVVTGTNAVSVTYTLTAGTDTAEGFIVLPYVLAGV